MANPNLPMPLPGEDPNAGMEGLGAGTVAYSKEEVGYRPADDSAQSCGACAHFNRKAQQSLGLGTCTEVAGQISPNGVCELFTPSKGIAGLEP